MSTVFVFAPYFFFSLNQSACEFLLVNILKALHSLMVHKVFSLVPDKTSSHDSVGLYRMCLIDIYLTILLHLLRWDNLHLFIGTVSLVTSH